MNAVEALDQSGVSALNQQVTQRLREAAELLEQQQANPFRVSAYRHAAGTGTGLNEDVAALLERAGVEGLDALPGSGPEGQRTVVTETRGPLAGRRVIRGREAECLAQLDPGSGFGARRGEAG